jgi:hypothetical protein
MGFWWTFLAALAAFIVGTAIIWCLPQIYRGLRSRSALEVSTREQPGHTTELHWGEHIYLFDISPYTDAVLKTVEVRLVTETSELVPPDVARIKDVRISPMPGHDLYPAAPRCYTPEINHSVCNFRSEQHLTKNEYITVSLKIDTVKKLNGRIEIRIKFRGFGGYQRGEKAVCTVGVPPIEVPG